MSTETAPNAPGPLAERRDAGALTWGGPASMLFARSGLAIGAQALVAGIFALRSSPTPWLDAAPWIPVYGTLIDAGCLALLWRLTRREGIRLTDLIGFDRGRLGRDILLGLALIPIALVFIVGGNYGTSLLLFGEPTPAYLFDPLPLPATLYALLVWPFVWGLVEQMTYNGYLAPRFQVLSRSTIVAVAWVGFAWSLQHVFMPLTFDRDLMIFRLISPLPYSVFGILVYFRIRRLLPLAVAHALMDGASVLVGVLTSRPG